MGTERIARRAEELTRAGQRFVVATVVRAQRPTSVRPGDRAVLRADGTVEGFVGGVCAADAVRRYGAAALRSGQPLLLRILPGAEQQTVTEEGAVTTANPCLSGGGVEIFLEPRRPPPLLVVVGETPVGVALTELAPALGYAVRVLPLGSTAVPAATAAVVVAAHGRDESPVLRAAVAAGVPYVGLVASKIRGAAVRDALDLPAEQRGRVRTPAGLAIGARTPPESALAILAEITATRPVPALEDAVVVEETVVVEDTVTIEDAAVAGSAVEARVDPVCGMTVPADPVAVAVAVQDSRIVGFCCPGCRDRYLAEPERYRVR